MNLFFSIWHFFFFFFRSDSQWRTQIHVSGSREIQTRSQTSWSLWNYLQSPDHWNKAFPMWAAGQQETSDLLSFLWWVFWPRGVGRAPAVGTIAGICLSCIPPGALAAQVGTAGWHRTPAHRCVIHCASHPRAHSTEHLHTGVWLTVPVLSPCPHRGSQEAPFQPWTGPALSLLSWSLPCYVPYVPPESQRACGSPGSLKSHSSPSEQGCSRCPSETANAVGV